MGLRGADRGGRQRSVSACRPFAFLDENAYYAREDEGLAFGYFHARQTPAGFTVPKGLVFTALSHDIVVHETSHALLDGLRSQFYDPGHPDVLGFHEGFADLVALFLHFTYADVVENAIAASRGSLSNASLLTDLAREFGYASSSPRNPMAMRSAVDVPGIQAFDSDALPPGRKGPTRYKPGMEEHDLGSVLRLRRLRGVRHRLPAQEREALADGRPHAPATWAQRSWAASWCAASRRRRACWPSSSSTSASARSTTAPRSTWAWGSTSGR